MYSEKQKAEITGNLVKPVRGRGRPRKFEIPETFQCLGYDITTVYMTQEELHAKQDELSMAPVEDVDALYCHEDKEIYLNEDLSGTLQEQAYLHELTHCLLEHAGYERLSADERLVGIVSELLYQFIVTKKGYINYEPHKESSLDSGSH